MSAPKLNRRMAGALLATLAVSAWLASQPDTEAVTAAAPRAAASGRPNSGSTQTSPQSPAQGRAPLPTVLAFARSNAAWPEAPEKALLSWAPPPPPPPPPAPVVRVERPVAAAPPPPTAPAFPYTLIGRFEDDKGLQALLVSPLKTVSARADDVIDGQWRVDKVLSDGMTLTWLPGNLQQTLNYRPS